MVLVASLVSSAQPTAVATIIRQADFKNRLTFTAVGCFAHQSLEHKSWMLPNFQAISIT